MVASKWKVHCDFDDKKIWQIAESYPTVSLPFWQNPLWSNNSLLTKVEADPELMSISLFSIVQQNSIYICFDLESMIRLKVLPTSFIMFMS